MISLPLAGQGHMHVDTIMITDRVPQQAQTPSSLHDLSEATGHVTLSDHLTKNTVLYARSYGLGSTATLSMRGGSANQNLLLWNGIPINNPMLGLADYSLAGNVTTDRVRLLRGGYSSFLGSGAVSGAILLEQDPLLDRKNEYRLSLAGGSFGQLSTDAKALLSSGRWASDTRIAYQKADNDFYYSLPGGSRRQNSNNHIRVATVSQSVHFRPAKGHMLMADFWLTDARREIPPTTTQNTSMAFQEDVQMRYALRYRGIGTKHIWNAAFAFIDEHNDYTDPLINLATENRFRKWYHHADMQFSPAPEWHVQIGHIVQATQAASQNYGDTTRYHTYSPGISMTKHWGKHKSIMALRKEWNSFRNSPLTFNLETTLSLSQMVSMRLKLSREYRLPTLNELFWQPGGDSDLLPEQGWSQELNMDMTTKDLGALSVTVFHRLIDNWILWAISEGDQFFSARNIARVRSYGTEVFYNASFVKASWKHDIRGGYTWTRSIHLQGLTFPAIDAGTQLIYTPEHKASLSYSLTYHGSGLSLNTFLTGPVNGINDNLEGYWVTDLALHHSFSTGPVSFRAALSIENICNTDYRVIERRPMPGRYIKCQLTCLIN